MTQKLFMLVPTPGSAIPKYVTTVDTTGNSIYSNGVPQKLATIPIVNMVSGVDMTDRLMTSGNELILSSRASEVLARHKIDPQIVRHKITLKSKEVQLNTWPSYELWYSLGEHSVLHSKAKTRKIKGHVLSVFEWVISSEAVPPFDLFLGPTSCWLGTERLIDSVFEAGLTGFGFAAIPSLPDSGET